MPILLDNYYKKLTSELVLEGPRLKEYKEALGPLLSERQKFQGQLSDPGTYRFEKWKARRSLDKVNIQIEKLRTTNMDSLLKSDVAKGHLRELIMSAKTEGIRLNLPPGMEHLADPKLAFDEEEFSKAFKDSKAAIPEIRASPEGKSLGKSLSTVRGATGGLLIGGGIGLMIFSVIGLREVGGNLSEGLMLTDEGQPVAQREQEIFRDFLRTIKEIFNHKWAADCLVSP